MAADTTTSEKSIVYQTGVLGSTTDTLPVELDEIKRIGFYSKENFSELADLFYDILETLHLEDSPQRYQLYTNRIIQLKFVLKQNAGGENTPVNLTTSEHKPHEMAQENVAAHLFFIDAIAIFLGIAQTIQEYYPNIYLEEYTKEFDIDEQLRDWGAGSGKEYVSQEAIAYQTTEIYRLLAAIRRAIQFVEAQAVNTTPEATTPETTPATTTTVPTEQIAQLLATLQPATGSMGDGATTESIISTAASSADPAFTLSSQFVVAAAKSSLLDMLLERSQLDYSDLSSESQQLYVQLTDIIREQLNTVLLGLTPEEAEAFIAGNVSVRTKVLRLLLIHLASHPETGFFALYLEFQKQQANALLAEEKITEARALALAATVSIDELIAETPELGAIKAEIETWKESFLAELAAAEAAATTQTTQASTPDDLDTVVTELNPPPITYESFSAQVSQLPALQEIDPPTQAALQNRSGHVIWGTLAQLFSEEDLKKNAIPPELFEVVSGAAYEYLQSLSPEELQKLVRSPSSLIRHIKNISQRLQTDAGFMEQYNTFSRTVDLPTIDRAERITAETEWAVTNIRYELFSAYNITDALLKEDPKLALEFEQVERELQEKIASIFLEFPTEYLQKLYLNPEERKRLLIKLQHELNADPRFLKELSEFYSELIEYYAEHGLLAEQEAVVEQLKKDNAVLVDGRYQVIGVGLSDAHELFLQRLRKELSLDAPTIAANTSTILDSLLITYGLVETTRLITGIHPDLLQMTFGLPAGLLSSSNEKAIRDLLVNYASVRIHNIVPTRSTTPGSYLAPVEELPNSATSLLRTLSPVREVTTLVQERGSEAASLALNGGIKERIDALQKVLGKKWNNLGLEERVAVYMYYDKPINVGLLQRIKSKSADLEQDKYLLPVFIEYTGFNDEILPELLAIARSTNFKQVYLTELPNTELLSELQNAHAQLAQAQRLELEMAYATFLELEDARKTAIAEEMQMTVAALTAAYENSLIAEQYGTPLPGASFSETLNSTAAGAQGARAGIPNIGQIADTAQKLRGLKNLAGGKIKEKIASQAAAKAATGLAGKAAAAATGVGAVVSAAMIGFELLKNEKFRNALIGMGTFVTAMIMNVIGNVAGLLTFLATSFIGGFTPLAMAMGLGLGQAVSAALPWARWLPQSRVPPNPLGFGTGEQSASSYPSLSEMRGNSAAPDGSFGTSPTAATTSVSPAVTPTATTTAATPTATAGVSSTTAASTSAASSGGLSGIAGVPIGVVAPLMAVVPTFIITIFTVTVIAGAFMVPVPTKPNATKTSPDIDQRAISKYLTITKIPSVGGNRGEIQNRTDVPITYTVTVQAKSGYKIQVNAFKDVFSSIGGASTDITSQLTSDAFASDPTEDPLTASYTISTGTNLEDTLLFNAFTATFDVYDYTGYKIESGETFTQTAIVYIGNPQIGCWPTTGNVAQLPGGSFSHSRLDAFDISNNIGTPVYAPFPGEVCDKGMDPSPSGGYGRYATLQFYLGTRDMYLIFGHFIKGPKDLMTGFDARGCRPVNAGEVIGLMDDTGYSTASHLHYELRDKGLGVKLKDITVGGQQAINDFNSGKRPVRVTDCFGGN